nr:galactokinase [Lachnospira multipara]
MKMTKRKMIEEFEKVFGTSEGVRVFFAPGRVNLIGEHTDYNGGHVFPCAIPLGTYAAIRKREDSKIRFFSLNYDQNGIIETRINNLKFNKTDWWTNYPKGVIDQIKKMGIAFSSGFEMLVYGDLPSSSGLSSSASIEVLTCLSMIRLYGIKLGKIKTALLCQKAENEFCGVNCGIMDQFAIAMGKKDHAIYLDTATLDYKYVPIKLDKIKLVITCSNKKRGLGSSKYNERRAECEDALRMIKESEECANIKTLGDLSIEQFERNKHYITDEVKLRRARHAVYENMRTIWAVEALTNNDIEKFGQLMNESHISLRDDYEVTGEELDALYDAQSKMKGVIGTRMTGAGFGGCAVSLVKEEYVDEFIEKVSKEYTKKTGLVADFYPLSVGGGPRELR